MFSSRRKAPKRVAREEPEAQDIEEEDGPVVRRPTVPKTKSKLRIAFNPGDVAEDEDGQTPVAKPSRLGPSHTSQSLPRFDQDAKTERPSYTKSTLDELRNSTPSTPKELTTYEPSSSDVTDPNTSLDIASKFGSTVTKSAAPSIIPSAAEIQEKKDRRARLALQSRVKDHEQEDFIPLESYDSDGEFKPQRLQLSTFHAPEKEKETRLLPDDEDLLEGFDAFTEDPGRVTISKKALKAQSKQERENIRSMIENASASSESDSETERNHAYESAQTNYGMDGLSALHASQKRQANRPRQPREITPIPKLAVALTRLRDAVSKIELEKVKIERRRADVRRERAEIKASQEHIQRSLEEAGRELAAIQAKEKENLHSDNNNGHGNGGDYIGNAGLIPSSTASTLSDRGRGLESFGRVMTGTEGDYMTTD